MLKIFIIEDKDIVQLYANENHKGMILKKASNLHENTIQPGDVIKICGYMIPDSLMKITHHWGLIRSFLKSIGMLSHLLQRVMMHSITASNHLAE